MGFNKRIINKENIDSNIKNLEYIIKLTNADALIMDNWSGSFYDNLDFKWKKYQKIRQEVIDESEPSSIDSHQKFNKLKKISNIYFNLINNPSLVDVLLATSVMNIDKSDMSIDYNDLVSLCIKKINLKYKNYE